MDNPKLDKKLLQLVSQHAKNAFKEASYSDGKQYLSADELVGKAWIEAYHIALNVNGYKIVKQEGPKNE